MANGNIIAELVNLINFEVNQNSIKQVNNTINTLKSGITRALGTIGIGLSIAGLNNIVESYQKMNREMAYLLQKSDDFGKTQKDILDAAEDARTSYQNMVSVVEALHTKNQNLFPVDEAIEFSTEVQKLLILSGRSETEAASLQRSLASIMGQSKITGSTLQSYASSAPILIDTVAESLGVARDELFRMADAGEVSAETIKRAITGMTDSIDEAFDNMDYTLSDVLRSIRNQWSFFVSDLDETLKISATINKFLMSMVNRGKNGLNTLKTYVISLTNALGGTQNLLRALVGLVTAFTLVTRWEQIMKALKMVVSLFSAGSVAALGMVAVVAILFLLIDDFIAFMQGRDSVMGYAFQQAGIDAEEMRDKIVKIWENLKKFFEGVGKQLEQRFKPVLDKIKKWFEDTFGTDVFDNVGEGIQGVIDFLGNLASVLANAIVWAGNLYTAYLAFSTATSIIEGIQKIATALMSPIGVMALIILALIAMRGKWDDVIKKIRKKLEDFRDFFKDTFGVDITGVIDAIIAAFQWMADFLQALGEGDLGKAISMIGGLFAEMLQGIPGLVSAGINGIVDTINWVIKKIVALQNTAANFANQFGAGMELWDYDELRLLHVAEERYATPEKRESIAKSEWGTGYHMDTSTGIIYNANGEAVKQVDLAEAPSMSSGGGMSTADKAWARMMNYGGNAVGNVIPPNRLGLAIVGDNRVEPEIISPVSKMIAAARTAFETSNLSSAIYALANARYASNATTYGPTTNSRSISQSVNINNTFNGERAIQQNAARIMDRSAGDITAELARALSYQF